MTLKMIWTSILVTNKLLTSLGLSSDYSIIFDNQTCNYTGISFSEFSRKISSLEKLDENYIIIDDKRIALNLNTNKIMIYSALPETLPLIFAFEPVASAIAFPHELHATDVDA